MEPHAETDISVMIARAQITTVTTVRQEQRQPACSRLQRIRSSIVSSHSVSWVTFSGFSLCGPLHLDLMKEELFTSQHLLLYRVSQTPGGPPTTWVALPPQPGEGWVQFFITTLYPLAQPFSLFVVGKHIFPLLLGKIIITIVLK